MDVTPYTGSEGYINLYSMPYGSEFIAKFLDDRELDEKSKIEFFQYLNLYNKSINGGIKEYCLEYFRKGDQKFLSINSYSGSRSIPFIRIKDSISFSNWIEEIVDSSIDKLIALLSDSKTPNAIRDIAFRKLRESEIREEVSNDPENAKYYLGIAALPTSVKPVLDEAKTDPYLIWSFLWPNSEPDLLSRPKIDQLDCRAGLSETIDLDKFIYSHDISSCVKLVKPTILDAEFYPQFHLGGRTKPLSACSHLEGFEEYIHEPNKFKNILKTPQIINK